MPDKLRLITDLLYYTYTVTRHQVLTRGIRRGITLDRRACELLCQHVIRLDVREVAQTYILYKHTVKSNA